MNRRDALKALMSLPATASLSVAKVQPDDVIVVECDDPVSRETAARIERDVGQAWPGRKVIVVSGGLHLKIARSEPT